MNLPPLPDKGELLAAVKAHRSSWSGGQKPTPEPTGPGEESVWDYPRPPELRPVDFGDGVLPCRVEALGTVIAESTGVLRMCETAGAPVYYFPPRDVLTEYLTPTDYLTVCEWKGAAVHFDLTIGRETIREAAFCYPDPLDDLDKDYARIAGWLGFYPAKMTACFVGDEKARPQPGGLYAGWVTSHIKSPIKGGPGTGGW